MICYDVEYKFPHKIETQKEKKTIFDVSENLAEKLNEALDSINEREDKCTLYNMNASMLRVVMVCNPAKDSVDDYLDKVIKVLCEVLLLKNMKLVYCEEITARQYINKMKEADKNHCLGSFAFISDKTSDFDYFGDRSFKVNEKIVSKNLLSRKEALRRAREILADKSLIDEIERIYSTSHPDKFYGFPVNYNIDARDEATAMEIVDLMVQMLNSRNRVHGTRVEYITDISSFCYEERNFEQIIKQAEGLAVVINCKAAEDLKGIFANGYSRVIKYIAKIVTKYRNKVLFFFIDDGKGYGFSKSLVNEASKSVDILDIAEGCGNKEQAIKYFTRLAKESDYAEFLSDEFIEYLPSDRNIYSNCDVREAFYEWSNNALRNSVYSAYSKCNLVKAEIKKEYDGNSYDRLQKMVGLNDVKKLVDKVIATYEIMSCRDARGLNNYDISRHMVFTGNPGSAKTTVARLLADILTEKSILSSGAFVECGRGDLVGKYVGWTAPLVQQKFREAEGGILFIDEAYSLVDGKSGLYGDEAINALVQEMENHRGDVIVIFAGYPDKMKDFIQRNEGLRSRIAFHIDFPDYTPEELLQIMKLMIEDRSYVSNNSIDSKCLRLFEQAVQINDFGNGRFVRNLLEDAMLNQAQRLIKSKQTEFTDSELKELVADDFDEEIITHIDSNSLNKKIGFCV